MTILRELLILALSLSCVRCVTAHSPYPSYKSIPSIFILNLDERENRESIRSLDGQKYSYEPLPECIIEIAHISIQEIDARNSSQQNSYRANDVVLNIVASCNNTSSAYERQCMISQLVDSDSLKLDRLRGKLEGCPKGSQVLNMHEDVARQLGAKHSVLDDMSEYEIYRGEEDVRYPILIRSTLFNAIFSPEAQGLSSYYSQFGYIYSHSKADLNILTNAVKFVRHFTIESLVSELDLRKFRGRFVRGILNKYKSSGNRDLHSLFTYLHASHEYQEQSDCKKLVEYVLSDTNKLGGVMQYDRHESQFIHSVQAINDIRQMIKKIN